VKPARPPGTKADREHGLHHLGQSPVGIGAVVTLHPLAGLGDHGVVTGLAEIIGQGQRADELRRAPAAIRFLSLEPLLGPLPSLDLAGIDWVIVGGESGPDFRPLDLGWVRDLRDRCVSMRIPLFFKQIGGLTPKAGGRLLDGRTWDQYPA
jgi:protein gp37